MTASSYVPLNHMIQVVQNYILIRKGISVIITPPSNDRELQRLGLAYDIAMEKTAATYTYTFS
jgi:hypothetical protein